MTQEDIGHDWVMANTLFAVARACSSDALTWQTSVSVSSPCQSRRILRLARIGKPPFVTTYKHQRKRAYDHSGFHSWPSITTAAHTSTRVPSGAYHNIRETVKVCAFSSSQSKSQQARMAMDRITLQSEDQTAGQPELGMKISNVLR